MDTHPFEKAGLGVGPFKVVRCERRVGPLRRTCPKSGLEIEIGAPGQPMGACEYCGTGIAQCWEIASSDGKRFIVGSECVKKTCDGGLIQAVKRRETKDRKAREVARIQAVRDMLNDPSARMILESVETTSGGRTQSLAQRAEWFMVHAGHAGKLRVAREVEKALK